MIAKDIIEKAKTKLLLKGNSVFISTILLNMKMEESKDIPTLAVNGKRIKYNPKFIESLDIDTTMSALAHETWHVAFEHVCPMRLGNRDATLWNVAGDYVINDVLKLAHFVVPSDWLHDINYRNWTTEEVYDDLEKKADKVPNPNWDDVEPIPIEHEGSTQTVKNIIIQAYQAAKQSKQDKEVPDAIAEAIEKYINPKLPWNVIFQNRFTEYNKSNYTYKRPHKKGIPVDVYLPRLYAEASIKPVIVVDVSGSIVGSQYLDAFFKEVKYMQEILEISEFRVVTFDTRIQEDVIIEEEFNPSIQLKGKGGGCTDISPVFYLLKGVEQPVIVFTDLYLHIPPDPQLDITWVVFGNSNQADYGFTIHITREELCT